MKILITGATGFYGHHLLKYILQHTDWDIVALSRENNVGDVNRLYELEEFQKDKDRVQIIWHDLRSNINEVLFNKILGSDKKIDYIFHIAASSHVDRSIEDPLSYVYDNVVGTANILEFARKIKGLKKFFYFSTDEVFGPAREDGVKFEENDRYDAHNPYSATKAGGEELTNSYFYTYDLPIVITHGMNILGERQHPEKYLPKIIRHLLNEEKVLVFTDDQGKIPAGRHYIYADEVSNALMFLIKNGVPGEKYNIEGTAEVDNLELAKHVAKVMKKKLNYDLVPGIKYRPGHDFSYAISGEKMRSMGYEPKYDFWEKLDSTIEWYLENQHWIM